MDAALWTQISATVKEITRDLTGLPSAWVNEPRKFGNPAGNVYLEVFGVRSIGVDELRTIEVEGPPPFQNLRRKVVGNRIVTITVTVETLSQAPDKAARVYLELFRMGMRRPSTLARLRAKNLALVEVMPLVPRDRAVDDRMFSIASVDLVLAASANDTDREEEATTTIDTVELQNRVVDADGQLLPESLAPRSELVGYAPAPPEEVIDVTQLPGFVEGWDPSSAADIALEDGDRVLSWSPMLDSNNTVVAQSGGPDRPRWVPDGFGLGYPAVEFDGVDDLLEGTAPTALWQDDLTAVFVAASVGASGPLLEYLDDAGVPSPRSFSVQSVSGHVRIYGGRTESAPIETRVFGAQLAEPLTQPRVISIRLQRSTGAILMRVDFENVATAALPSIPSAAASGAARFVFRGSGLRGRMAFFNRVLTPEELLQVERWAAVEAGLYVPPSEATLCLPPGAELQAYWRFNGDGQDASGNGRHLSFGTVPPSLFVPGTRGAALSVAGNPARRAFRTVPDTALEVRATDFTIQAWVRFADTTGDQVLLEKFSDIGWGWTLIKLFDDTFMFFGDLAGGYIGIPPPITPDVWHHLVVRRAGGNLRMWFDGALILDASAAGAFSNQTGTPFQVGRRSYDGSGVAALNGSIDEVAFWRRALSDGEIGQLWNGGSGYPICLP